MISIFLLGAMSLEIHRQTLHGHSPESLLPLPLLPLLVLTPPPLLFRGDQKRRPAESYFSSALSFPLSQKKIPRKKLNRRCVSLLSRCEDLPFLVSIQHTRFDFDRPPRGVRGVGENKGRKDEGSFFRVQGLENAEERWN